MSGSSDESFYSVLMRSNYLTAQHDGYETSVDELKSGKTPIQLAWFIFPQLRGSGENDAADHFGLSSAGQARAYLADPVLGSRLRDCVSLVLGLSPGGSAELFDTASERRLHACLTLFKAAALGSADEHIFAAALGRFYSASDHPRTIELLGAEAT